MVDLAATTLFESDTMQRTDPDAKPRRLLALAALLQAFRAEKKWSVEQAALHAGLGHMTWRRCEGGTPARLKTYAQMDGLFGLPLGTISRATNDDDLMADLARHLGVDPGDDAAAWVRDYARGATPAGRLVEPEPIHRSGATTARATLGGLAGVIEPPKPKPSDVAAVVDVVERIQAWGPNATNSEAISSLLTALQNHLIDPSTHRVTTERGSDGSIAVHVEPIE